MSKKFVRNITNTRIKGAIQEPLNTNIQNDLLSDGEDVAVRNKDEYHLLTDNVKSITSGNDAINVKVTGKNSRELVAKIVELTTETDEVTITNPETNVFTIDIDFSGYTDTTLFESEIQRLENEIENVEVDLSDYATTTYVDNAINEIDGAEVDLSNYATLDNLNNHIDRKNNPHNVTKGNVGLDKVENRASGDIEINFDVSSINMYEKESVFSRYLVRDNVSPLNINFGNTNNKRTEFVNIIFIANQNSQEKNITLLNPESVIFLEDLPETIRPKEILMIKYVYFHSISNGEEWMEQVILEVKTLTHLDSGFV